MLEFLAIHKLNYVSFRIAKLIGNPFLQKDSGQDGMTEIRRPCSKLQGIKITTNGEYYR